MNDDRTAAAKCKLTLVGTAIDRNGRGLGWIALFGGRHVHHECGSFDDVGRVGRREHWVHVRRRCELDENATVISDGQIGKTVAIEIAEPGHRHGPYWPDTDCLLFIVPLEFNKIISGPRIGPAN